MNILLILKAIALIGLILNVVMMLVSTKKLASTADGKANIASGMKPKNLVVNAIVGIGANFLDTLGIGSFATSSTVYKVANSVDDMLVPGTLNAGDAVPVCLEAFLFFDAFDMDGLTCLSMCIAATLGAYLMAGVVSGWNRKMVRLGFGIGLVVLAAIMLCRSLGVGPFGTNGTLNGLQNNIPMLVVACVLNFILGAAMCLGVGLYAPCMALTVLMGMNASLAFPLMMGSCAFLMAFGNGPKFITEGKYDIVASWCNAIGGAVGVFVAFYLVKSLDLKTITYIVIFVCALTGVLYLKDAILKGDK